MFSREFCEILKNSIFYRTPLVAAFISRDCDFFKISKGTKPCTPTLRESIPPQKTRSANLQFRYFRKMLNVRLFKDFVRYSKFKSLTLQTSSFFTDNIARLWYNFQVIPSKQLGLILTDRGLFNKMNS